MHTLTHVHLHVTNFCSNYECLFQQITVVTEMMMESQDEKNLEVSTLTLPFILIHAMRM